VAQPEAATIRVAISKVDQLINLVGELVITQAMLVRNSRALDPAVYQQLLTGLADLDRNTQRSSRVCDVDSDDSNVDRFQPVSTHVA